MVPYFSQKTGRHKNAIVFKKIWDPHFVQKKKKLQMLSIPWCLPLVLVTQSQIELKYHWVNLEFGDAMSSFTVMNVAKPFLLACNEPSTCFLKIPKIAATTLNNRNKVLPLRCKSFSSSSNGDWLEVSKEIDNEKEFIVVNFYRFVFIKDPEEEVSKHLSFMEVDNMCWVHILGFSCLYVALLVKNVFFSL